MTAPNSSRAQQLAYRRARLRAECAMQRRQLGENARAIETELQGVDRTIQLARRVASKPVLITGAIAALALIGPKRVLRWISQGALYYSTARRLMGLFRRPSADRGYDNLRVTRP